MEPMHYRPKPKYKTKEKMLFELRQERVLLLKKIVILEDEVRRLKQKPLDDVGTKGQE
jgi:hypothetical protein